MKIVAKTFAGLEEVLVHELNNMQIQAFAKRRAVEFEANLEQLYYCSLNLRTALSLLIPIDTFKAKSPEELYGYARKIRWEKFMNVDQTFAIDASVKSEFFKHSQFTALKLKDAIADHFRKIKGKRPNVNPKSPDIKFQLNISGENCRISLDSSGKSLFKRGYRVAQNEAPLNEVLAAGLVLLSAWDKKTTLFDPMCGSGTIAIEAAKIALGISPHSAIRRFAFQNWKNFDESLWKKVQEESFRIKNPNPPKILASDINEKSIAIAKKNIKSANLEEFIKIKRSDFFKTSVKSAKSLQLIFNPPYDERLKVQNVNAFYKSIGDHLKNNFPNANAWIFSGNKDALKRIGLKASKKFTLYNGPILSKFHLFELF